MTFSEPTPRALEVLAAMSLRRHEGIRSLCDKAKAADGKEQDRGFWAMIWDFDGAAQTTNRDQLTLMGVELPPVGTYPALMTDEAVSTAIREIVTGLGWLRTTVIGSRGLDDRTLLERLILAIDDEIREVLSPDCREMIDVLDLVTEDDLPDTATPPSHEPDPRCPTDADLDRWATLIAQQIAEPPITQ